MGKWILLPTLLTNDIKKEFVKGVATFDITEFYESLEKFAKSEELQGINPKLWEWCKKKFPSVRTVSRALNCVKAAECGVFERKLKLADLICIHAFKITLTEVLGNHNLRISDLGVRLTGHAEQKASASNENPIIAAGQSESLEQSVIDAEGDSNIILLRDWKPDPNKTDHRQGLDFILLPLSQKLPVQISWTVFSDSRYYRCGIKFIGDRTIGDEKIESSDSVLFHTGIWSMFSSENHSVFTALFIDNRRPLVNGKAGEDRFTNFKPSPGQGYDCVAYIDDNDYVHFSVNGIVYETAHVGRSKQNKIALFAWADNLPYELVVKNIRIEIQTS